jgi:MFS family permease
MLIAVPLMPDVNSAVAMLLARSSLSQMDVPARKAFVAMSVDADERSAAGGITNIVRSLGVASAPLFWGSLMSVDADSLDFKLPFIIAGGLKIVYDVALFFLFRSFSQPTDKV